MRIIVYYNLKIAVTLKQRIKQENTYEIIANFLFNCMCMDETLKLMHAKNMFKLYNFCNLYLPEKDGIYLPNKVYFFDVKFLDIQFAIKVKHYLSSVEDKYLSIVMSSIKTNEYHIIHKLISLTPAIATTKEGNYLINPDKELVKKSIENNMKRKYEQVFSSNITFDFVKDISILNEKPIKIPYKNICFLGNKFELLINEDLQSQKLAFLALSTGILEKNSLGFGFCKAR